MARHFISQIALASQIFAASAGLYVLATPASAETVITFPTLHKMSKADRDLTQRIRRAVVTDKSLSLEAQNVHIVAVDGAVTLIGPVRSYDERNAVIDKANEIAGADRVTDQLIVAQK